MKTSYPIANIPQYDQQNPVQGPYKTAFLGNYELCGEGSGSHPGVDIAVPIGTPLLAVADGKVVTAKNSPSWGKYLVVSHEAVDGTMFFSCSCHLSELLVGEGDMVVCGQQIGKTGNTGASTGPHLHFQIDRFLALVHPFWPFSKKEASCTMDGVNQCIGSEKVKLYCENPLVFLQKVQGVPSFSDIVAKNQYHEAISALSADGVIHGFPDGTFRPESPVTRAEFCKMFCKMLHLVVKPHPIPFKDVKKTDWAFPYIGEAFSRGWVAGFADKTFRPNGSITRAESVKLLCAALGKNLSTVQAQPFSDVPAAEWYAPFATFAKEQAFFSFTNDQFEQNKAITRGEAAGMLWKMRGK